MMGCSQSVAAHGEQSAAELKASPTPRNDNNQHQFKNQTTSKNAADAPHGALASQNVPSPSRVSRESSPGKQDPQAVPAPDTRDMHAVHNVFRQALTDPAGVFARADCTDASTRDALSQYYGMVLDFLHAHHGSEDELLWPVLLPRCSEAEAALVRAGEAQHAQLHEHLATADSALAEWMAAAASGSECTAALVAALCALGVALLPHQADEEAHVMPLVAKHMTPEEYGQLPGGTMQKLRPEHLFTCIGYVRGEFNQELLDAMDANMPPPVADGWRGGGKAAYEALRDAMAPLLSAAAAPAALVPAPDTRDMHAVHNVFRQALTDPAGVFARADCTDASTRDALSQYYGMVLDFLHAHHGSEDELLWPVLLPRCSEAEAALVRAGEAQHAQLHEHLAAADSALAEWMAAAAASGGDAVRECTAALVAALCALGGALLPHLADEEAHVMPLVAKHMTAEEYGQLPGGTMQKLRPEHLFTCIGYVRGEFNQELLDAMDANMPPPVADGWRGGGKAAYEALRDAMAPLLVAGEAVAPVPMPDTRDMHAVHNVFRQALTDPAGVFARADCSDASTRDALSQYYGMVLDFLHAHHGSEDELLWPVLLPRCSEAEAALVRAGEAQHAQLHEHLAAADSALAAWVAAAASGSECTAALVAALSALGVALLPHLADEEAHVMPLVAKHMTAEEYGQVPGGTMQKLRPEHLFTCIGYVRGEFNQELLDAMDAHMPPPVADGWRGGGKAAYEALRDAMAPLLSVATAPAALVPAPDTRDMHAVHNVFRQALTDPASVFARADCSDASTRDALSQYYGMVLDFLHAHHGSEDELLWPVLLPRCSEAEAALVRAGEAQHAQLHEHLGAADSALAAWVGAAASGGDAVRECTAALVAALSALGGALLPHLADEEAHVMPLVSKHMTAEEYGQVPGGTMQKLRPEHLFTCIGYVRGEFNQELLDAMDAHMPPPVADGWRGGGKAAYEALRDAMAPLLSVATAPAALVPAPDTRDMHAVHNVFRQALTDPASVFARADCSDAGTRDALSQYYGMVLDFLHAHHGSEDELLWPVLLPRCSEAEAALVRAGEAQHAQLHEHLGAADSALAEWVAAAAAASDGDAVRECTAALVAALSALGVALLPHLADEEAHVMPLVAKHMTAEEYGQVPGGTMQKLRPEHLFTCIGYVRGEFNQELLDAMDAHMPPPVADGWRGGGKAAYEALRDAMAPLLDGSNSA